MREALIEAFEKASEAHAMAFIQVDGEDPDWALWYAGFLQQALLQRIRSWAKERW